jgi:hypothetical protein
MDGRVCSDGAPCLLGSDPETLPAEPVGVAVLRLGDAAVGCGRPREQPAGCRAPVGSARGPLGQPGVPVRSDVACLAWSSRRVYDQARTLERRLSQPCVRYLCLIRAICSVQLSTARGGLVGPGMDVVGDLAPAGVEHQVIAHPGQCGPVHLAGVTNPSCSAPRTRTGTWTYPGRGHTSAVSGVKNSSRTSAGVATKGRSPPCPVVAYAGCEQLQGDVVGVAERQGRAVVGVGDPAVVDAELLQPGLPFFQLGAVGDPGRRPRTRGGPGRGGARRSRPGGRWSRGAGGGRGGCRRGAGRRCGGSRRCLRPGPAWCPGGVRTRGR